MPTLANMQRYWSRADGHFDSAGGKDGTCIVTLSSMTGGWFVSAVNLYESVNNIARFSVSSDAVDASFTRHRQKASQNS